MSTVTTREYVLDAWAVLSKAWNWWLGELVSLIPKSILACIKPSDEKITVECSDEMLVVNHVVDGIPQEIERGAISDGDLKVIGDRSERTETDRLADRIVLIIPSNELLVRRVRLPAAARSDLSEILKHEVERQSPLDPSEIYFDYRVVEKNGTHDSLDVELRLVKRAVIDKKVRICAAVGLSPLEAEFIDTAGSVIGAPFVLDRAAVFRRHLRKSVAPALAIVVLILTILFANTALDRRDVAIEQMRHQIEEIKSDAQAVEKLRSDISGAEARMTFLANLRKTPLAIEVLSDVTRIIPDKSWVYDFELNGREVRLRGYSPEASNLVGLIDSSPLFVNAQFRSPLVQGQEKGTERFDLSFDLRQDKP